MLPALTVARRRFAPTRAVVMGALAFALSAGAALSSIATSPAPALPPGIADTLHPETWAMTVPTGWLVAPPPRLRPGDALDILAVHPGDKAFTVPVAYAVLVVSSDDHGLVLQVDQDDAVALANARGGGMLLVPLLRSTR